MGLNPWAITERDFRYNPSLGGNPISSSTKHPNSFGPQLSPSLHEQLPSQQKSLVIDARSTLPSPQVRLTRQRGELPNKHLTKADYKTVKRRVFYYDRDENFVRCYNKNKQLQILLMEGDNAKKKGGEADEWEHNPQVLLDAAELS